jgi:hypothetical protein
MPERPHVFRAMKENRPDETAFLSSQELGYRVGPNATPERRRRLAAVSTWITLEKAIEAALAYDQGNFIAELDLEKDASIELEVDDRGHVDLWGDRQAMAGCVVAVHDAQSDV